MGRWYFPSHKTSKIWPHLYSTNTKSIYHRLQKWYVATFTTSVNQRLISTERSADKMRENPPEDSIPINQVGEHLFEYNNKNSIIPPERTSEPSSWIQYVENLPTYEQTMLINHTIIDDWETFTYLRTNESLILSSDGSARDKKASGAWLIAKKVVQY